MENVLPLFLHIQILSLSSFCSPGTPITHLLDFFTLSHIFPVVFPVFLPLIFNPFTFNVIIDMVEFMSAILLLVFYLLFFLFSVPLLLPSCVK